MEKIEETRFLKCATMLRKDNLSKIGRARVALVISVTLLNMTSAAPLSVVLSLLSQRKEGKKGRSVSHVEKGYEDYSLGHLA